MPLTFAFYVLINSKQIMKTCIKNLRIFALSKPYLIQANGDGFGNEMMSLDNARTPG